ncbi:MAG: universal stress protein [Deltaproteobacteria bacterium]|jgi:nucleotide-binding universal stress UspA family protein
MASWNRILVAVDETETSRRALRYLGEIVGCTEGLEICLLHVYPEPPPYYLREGHSLTEYQQDQENRAQTIFAAATDLLAGYQIPAAVLRNDCRMAAPRTPISAVVLQAQAEGHYGTVVVGKRGVSKAEEFLFGSISNAVVRSSSGFTVWVVG